jgi:hypothetical protein
MARTVTVSNPLRVAEEQEWLDTISGGHLATAVQEFMAARHLPALN